MAQKGRATLRYSVEKRGQFADRLATSYSSHPKRIATESGVRRTRSCAAGQLPCGDQTQASQLRTQRGAGDAQEGRRLQLIRLGELQRLVNGHAVDGSREPAIGLAGTSMQELADKMLDVGKFLGRRQR